MFTIGRTRRRVEPAPPQTEEAQAERSPAWQLVLRALRDVSGFSRGVIYDVPLSDAPEQVRDNSIFLRGSPAWLRFLGDREQMDDGELKVLLALRPLPESERRLVVDWGTSYSNSFLLIEPRRRDCDLTDPVNGVRRRLEEIAATLVDSAAATAGSAAPWARDTALGAMLREKYGAWIYWTGTWPWLTSHRVMLVPSQPSETLAGPLQRQLHYLFPQAEFDRAVAGLWRHESELFRGRVTQARIPFRTRSGLPILHDPRYVDRALRRLVNEGRLWVSGEGAEGRVRYGPGHPIPDSMSEEEFERLTF